MKKKDLIFPGISALFLIFAGFSALFFNKPNVETNADADVQTDMSSVALLSNESIDTSKIIYGNWYKSILYPSVSEDYSINDLLDQEKSGGNASIEYAKIGLPSLSDYIKAINTDSACKTDMFKEDTEDCVSWLTEYKGWTLDINGELGSDQDGYAYYIGNTNNLNNKVLFQNTSEGYNVYPVIYLNRNSFINSGQGTSASPYILK